MHLSVKIKNSDNRVSIWTRDTYLEDHLKIQLPVEQDFDDYSLRMSEIMETLEKAENRSQLDILSELITTAPNVTIQGLAIQVNAHKTDGLGGEITFVGVVVDQTRVCHQEIAKCTVNL